MTSFSDYQKWIKIGVLNLAIVALYGMIMRYKIAFEFPYFTQKSLLFAHSNFAFNGWISQVLYTGLSILIIQKLEYKVNTKKYKWILISNLIASYGMLIAFTAQGYKLPAVAFTLMAIVVAIVFTIFVWKDTKRFPKNEVSKPWMLMAVAMNILSALGPLGIAYIIVERIMSSELYLGISYYFLHFQYNGWFFFAGMAMVSAMLPVTFPSIKKHFNIFAITVIPTFFLSILWVKLPMWLFIVTIIASLAQLAAWIHLVIKHWPILKQHARQLPYKWVNLFLFSAAIAMTIKFALQAVSVIPDLSHLVFGIRSIVIAYIHLILLGVFSLFLLGYAFQYGYLKASTWAKYSSIGFFSGVALNELALGIQGMAGMFYIPIPHVQEVLFVAGFILFTSAFSLFLSQFRK